MHHRILVSEMYVISTSNFKRCVSFNMFYVTVANMFLLCTGISCDKLGLNNGVILYTPDSATPYVTGTIATHKCAEGFALIGESMRTCELTNVTQGRWSGLAPTCDRKYIIELSNC